MALEKRSRRKILNESKVSPKRRTKFE